MPDRQRFDKGGVNDPHDPNDPHGPNTRGTRPGGGCISSESVRRPERHEAFEGDGGKTDDDGVETGEAGQRAGDEDIDRRKRWQSDQVEQACDEDDVDEANDQG